jgi:hypoxanthine phosphoribosyltransferase/nucleoside 2-deoxyribosyltransferase
MESFGAANLTPWENIKREIDEADCCVTIVAGKYGSLDETGVSYTEKEYTYAVEQGKPVFCFLHKDINSLPGRDLESDPKLRQKLERFRKLCEQKQCSFWETIGELENQLTRSLAKFIQENVGQVLGRTHGFTSDGIPNQRNSNIREEVRILAEDKSVLLYARKLNIARPGAQTLLSWSEFGYGIELLMKQMRSAKSRFAADTVIGVNEAGLSIAAFLSGSLMHRCPVGFLRVDASKKKIREEWLPSINSGAVVLVVDVEIKTGTVLKKALSLIRSQLKPGRLYVACLGAQAIAEQIEDEITVSQLECGDVLKKSKLDGFFAAFIGPPPSLEPPLYLD